LENNNYVNDVFIGFQNENLDKSYNNTIYFIIKREQNKKVLEAIESNPFNINVSEVAQLYNPDSLVYKSGISKLYASNDVLTYFISMFKSLDIKCCIK
jgi:hypothetical protein